ncbi:zinc-binding dehydrogenase [Schaalia sp. lx-100]|uniref:zinc-binding dehydrogenase n=1 Tax=Schaalia sp. lx-100 TaxID=2899081 RepID=UPI001E4B3B28|nr:zinc-binding dehydrogenase [Schaalia sp. lx-100]MCD4557751.1 zinc-binding dehydrogenase [Schaalia sp. lx-100]
MIDAPDKETLEPGEVIAELVAGGLCGSDLPTFFGRTSGSSSREIVPGAPMHEVVGKVLATRSARLKVGDLVVGALPQYIGIAEQFRCPDSNLVPVDPRLPQIEAVTAQPVATVLNSVARIPAELPNRHAAVFGLGPLGLAFCHVLKSKGFEVTGIDRVDRSEVAEHFGIDHFVHDSVEQWVQKGEQTEAPAVVVDAIGHDQDLVIAAIKALAPHGHFVEFGLAEKWAVFPLKKFLQKHLSMHACTTTDWIRFLEEGQRYVAEHPELYEIGVTHRFHPWDAQKAFELHSVPQQGRLKVLLVPSMEAPAE